MTKQQLRAQLTRELRTAKALHAQAFCNLYRLYLEGQILRLTRKLDEIKPTPRKTVAA